MRTLTLNELDSVSGGASGRDIAMAVMEHYPDLVYDGVLRCSSGCCFYQLSFLLR